MLICTGIADIRFVASAMVSGKMKPEKIRNRLLKEFIRKVHLRLITTVALIVRYTKPIVA